MFQLQRFFSTSSLIIILLTAVLLGIFYRALSINLLLSDGENKNVAIAQVLASSLWPQIEPLLTKGHAPVASDATRRLHRQVDKQIAGLQVIKIKIYHPSGMVVFSTDVAQIGEDQHANRGVADARQGKVSNAFVKRDHFNPFDLRNERKDLLQTYMPLSAPGSDNITGVFEVYSDYTPLLARVVRVQWMVVAGTGVILMLLYAALLLLVRHAEGIINRQNAQLLGTVEELEGSRAQLEQRVEERTQTLQESNQNLEAEVHQRVRMAQIIREREQRLRAVMDSLLNAIIVTDDQGVIESINSSAEKLYGLSGTEITGNDLRCLFADGAFSELDKHRAPLQQRLIPLLDTCTEQEAKHRDGTVFPVEMAITRSNHDGLPLYIVSIRDISAQKRAETKLEGSRQKHLHQEKMAAIGTLSAGIVHEIGNPIAAIDGLIQEICDSEGSSWELTPEVRADLDLVRQQIQRLIQINRDVSEFASPQGEARQLVDFNNLVARTCRLMRYDHRMESVVLRLDLDPALPAVYTHGDQLIQVLMNLVSNAADAVNDCQQREGEIVVRTQLEGEKITLSVEDNGTGMDQETFEQALDAFYTTKAAGKGTGLGLSICHSIASLEGGEIEIETTVDQGTCVKVHLPATGSQPEK